MQDRRGVVMVFYDLPMGTSAQRRHYTVFHKHLMREGFVQMQESLYVKLVHNISSFRQVEARVKGFSPVHGTVQILCLNLNIFCTIKTFGKGGFDVAFFSDDIFFA